MVPDPEITIRSQAPATLSVAGALVFDNAADALKQAVEALRGTPHETLDLAGVTRADSAGLACVLAVLAAAGRHGSRLDVINMPANLAALAKVCEVTPLLARG